MSFWLPIDFSISGWLIQALNVRSPPLITASARTHLQRHVTSPVPLQPSTWKNEIKGQQVHCVIELRLSCILHSLRCLHILCSVYSSGSARVRITPLRFHKKNTWTVPTRTKSLDLREAAWKFKGLWVNEGRHRNLKAKTGGLRNPKFKEQLLFKKSLIQRRFSYLGISVIIGACCSSWVLSFCLVMSTLV